MKRNLLVVVLFHCLCLAISQNLSREKRGAAVYITSVTGGPSQSHSTIPENFAAYLGGGASRSSGSSYGGSSAPRSSPPSFSGSSGSYGGSSRSSGLLGGRSPSSPNLAAQYQQTSYARNSGRGSGGSSASSYGGK